MSPAQPAPGLGRDEVLGPGLYVHVPFCHSECTYCDFYRVSYRDRAADAFLDGLSLELDGLPRDLRPRTVYVGGGTPSALKVDQLERLLGLLEPFWLPGQERTFEVNPRSATLPKIELLQRAGVTRVSFGAQTFGASALRMLGRRHGPEDIGRVYGLLRERIPSISFDLIFALPGRSLEEWDFDLTSALALRPDHLSIYSLIYEPGTPLAEAVGRGEVEPVPEGVEREMLLLAVSRATGAGYEHYEVSSYSLAGHRSRHNQAYWEQRDYIGVGPGAWTTLGSLRTMNAKDLDGYVRGLRERGVPPRLEERLGEAERLNEHILLRLRTADGLSLRGFRERAGRSLEEHSGGRLGQLVSRELLAADGDRIRLTLEGLCVADRIIAELMA
ncbi:MAG: radical SAM family heme chaperone HemW [Planctomycetes bacterium]|nr:radical SAM family heme chaperone HemW [Planctomycetota bacterium]